jgi:hypothetical protein
MSIASFISTPYLIIYVQTCYHYLFTIPYFLFLVSLTICPVHTII